MPNDGLGVVGELDAVLAFKALGLSVEPAETPQEIQRAVFRLAEAGVPVIFLTETAARLVPETLERYRTSATTILIPIPGSRGTDGFSMARIKANVEKAIGADILFDREG